MIKHSLTQLLKQFDLKLQLVLAKRSMFRLTSKYVTVVSCHCVYFIIPENDSANHRPDYVYCRDFS